MEKESNRQVSDSKKEKNGIKIITTGFMIKQMTNFFKKNKRNWTYYPEWYNYNLAKSIMYYLSYSNTFNNKLTLEDLIAIDPNKEPRYRNKFVKNNSHFFEEFVYNETYGSVLEKLIDRLENKHPSYFKKLLKSNKKFWAYLTR